MLVAHATLSTETHSALKASGGDRIQILCVYMSVDNPSCSAVIPCREVMSRRRCTTGRMTATPVLHPMSCTLEILHLRKQLMWQAASC